MENIITFNDLYQESHKIYGLNFDMSEIQSLIEISLNEAEDKSESGFKRFISRIIEILTKIKNAIIGLIKKFLSLFKKKKEEKKSEEKPTTSEAKEKAKEEEYIINSFVFKDIKKVCDHVEYQVIQTNLTAITGILVLLERYNNDDMDDEISELQSKIINYDEEYKNISESDKYVYEKGTKIDYMDGVLQLQSYDICQSCVDNIGKEVSRSVNESINKSNKLSDSVKPEEDDSQREKDMYKTYYENAKKGITIVTQLEKSTLQFIEKFFSLCAKSYDNLNKLLDAHAKEWEETRKSKEDMNDSIKNRHAQAADEIKKAMDNINKKKDEDTETAKKIVGEVMDLALNGNIKGIRYIFVDGLDVDPTFKKYKYAYDYEKGMIKFLDDHEELTPFKPKDQWDKNYYDTIKNDCIKNFSEKRFSHLREVAKVVYADKIRRLVKERNK